MNFDISTVITWTISILIGLLGGTIGAVIAGKYSIKQARITAAMSVRTERLNDLRSRMAAFILRSYSYREDYNLKGQKEVVQVKAEQEECTANLYSIILSLTPEQENLKKMLHEFYAGSKGKLSDKGEKIDIKTSETELINEFNRFHDKEWKKISG